MTDRCPIFPVRSGVPLIGLGILMLLFAIVPAMMPGMVPLPLPVAVLFIGAGFGMIWLGLTR